MKNRRLIIAGSKHNKFVFYDIKTKKMQDSDIIKLIFAFKVKYLRQNNHLSYKQLSEQTGLSTSYLHDIEKGKKYPKFDKINALATAFGISYDELVSTQASKKMQPVIDMLNSDFWKIFPTQVFGLDSYRLFELFSSTPDKVNAFISTIFNITRHYQLRSENIYTTALRSYQNIRDNYFEEVELAVQAFKKQHHIEYNPPLTTAFLSQLLLEKYGISIDRKRLKKEKSLESIRSYYSAKQKKLFINQGFNSAQENFLIARELAFQFLEFELRPYLTRIIQIDSFEKLLNYFKASYFSSALLMDEQQIANDFQQLMQQSEWQEKNCLDLLKKYDVTPEMLLQRLTNVLPKHFGIDNIFFLRMRGSEDLSRFNMTKEIHLGRLHDPYANQSEEHYCRRWISINIIKRLRAGRPKKNTIIADAQISKYWETPNEYLCISLAKPHAVQSKASTSVTIGLFIDEKLRKICRFLTEPTLKVKAVNTTCERCSMPNCGARAFSPIVLEEKREEEDILEIIRKIG